MPKRRQRVHKSGPKTLQKSNSSSQNGANLVVNSTLPLAPTPQIDNLRPKRHPQSSHATYVVNAQEFQEALASHQVQITLGANILVSENLLISHDVAIDFNGFSIIAAESFVNARVLDIRSGEVTLTGKGKIFAMGPQGVAIRVFGAISSDMADYTHVTIDEDISLFAPDSYAILISPNLGVAYGVHLEIGGKIFAHDGITIASGIQANHPHMPAIHIKSSAELTVDETTGIALDASGIGKWQIDSAKIKAATGVHCRGGELNFMHTQITASQGPVFRTDDTVAESTTINIRGGTYLSESDTVYQQLSAQPIRFQIQDAVLCSSDQSGLENVILDNVEQRTNIPETLQEVAPSTAPTLLDTSTTEPADLIPTALLPSAPDTNATITQPLPLEETPASNDDVVSISQTSPIESYLPPQETPQSSDSLPIHPLHSPDSTNPSAILSPSEILSLWMPNSNNEEGLRDDETDEAEILLDLMAEKDDAMSTSSSTDKSPAPSLDPEEPAACAALRDALNEMKKLRAEDYEVGFFALEQSILRAEAVLSKPHVALADIRDAATTLLRAFDGLEERNELSLSDAELDELFYHGAVLNEISRPYSEPALAEKPTFAKTSPLPNSPSSDQLEFIAEEPAPLSAPVLPLASTTNHEPDFSILSEILATISGLNLANYTKESQATLLEVLDRTQAILTNPSAQQSEIDELASSLLAEMSELQPLHLIHASAYRAQTSAPEPVISPILPASMLDELNPIVMWSSGVAMIDENTPFVTDADTRARLVRAMRPWLSGFWSLATESLRKKAKSLSAGWHAGVHAYRDSLRSSGAR